MFSYRKTKKKKRSTKNGIRKKFSRLSGAKKLGVIFVIVFALAGSAYLLKSYAADAGAEADFVSRTNSVRASRGLPPLGTNGCLTDIARAWSQHLADINAQLNSGINYHSNLNNYFNCGGNHVGENLGQGPSVVSIQDALVASPGHLANIVNPVYNTIGVGVSYGGGQMYVVEAFSDCGCGAVAKRVPPPPRLYKAFASVPGSGKGYKFSNYGEGVGFGGKSNFNEPGYWPLQDILRSATVNTNGAGYKLDKYGGLHAFDGAPRATGGAYWSGADVARDVKLVGSTTKGYLLDMSGGIFAINGAAKASGGPYWAGQDVAKKLALLSNGTGGYVLDNRGALHPFRTGSNSKPPSITNGPYFGFNIARSVIMKGDGSQGFVLDGYGGVHPFSKPGVCKPPNISNSFYISGADAFTDITITSWGSCTSKAHGYVLDVFGRKSSF